MRCLRWPDSDRRLYLLEPLGKGGFAEAWRARRSSGVVEDEVCAKLPLERMAAEHRSAFIEEARVLSRVRHSNVVALLDAIEHPQAGVVIVLELVRGVTLRRLCAAAQRGVVFPECVVASIGVSLCRALSAAQRGIVGGVVHRDVTPGNVLISCAGEVKLSDFGIARAGDRAPWTAAGRIKGKAGYVSPEQLRGEPLDVGSDLFAVGVILHELLTGERPYAGKTPLETLARIGEGRRVPPPARWAHVSPGLRARVEALLARERPDRPATADQAARQLHAWSNEQRALEVLGTWARRAGPGPRPTRASSARRSADGDSVAFAR